MKTYIQFLLTAICVVILTHLLEAQVVMEAPAQREEQAAEDYTLYFTGGLAMVSRERREAVLTQLKAELEKSGKNSAIVFLGNNIKLNKERDKKPEKREELEKEQLKPYEFLKKYKGEIAFIPGDEEWLNGRSMGWENVQYVEEVVEKYLDNGNTFKPNIGCPQPGEIELGDDVLVLLLNTYWWMHHYDKPDVRYYECDAGGDQKFINLIDNNLSRYKEKKVIIAGHHPIYSNEREGDISNINFRYVEFKRAMLEMLEKHPNAVYISDHDHNLQYIQRGEQHYVVSGLARSNQQFKNNTNDFLSGEPGYSRMIISSTGDVTLEFVKVGDNASGEVLFSKLLYNKPPVPEYEEGSNPYTQLDQKDYSDSTITLAASTEYAAGSLKRLFWGNHYRNEWITPITVPYLDLRSDKGGLIPVEQGGGQQTKSLRLLGADGYIYNIRSVNKDPSKVLPDELKNTVAASILQDQISTAHPYGALAIPPLAEAADIFYMKPQLYYVPNTPLLGRYQEDFGGTLVQLELRPDDDLSAYARFGNSENVVSTKSMTEETTEDNDNEVDARFFARSRLFDILVGDWDRHEDQWRWAEYEKENEKGNIYKAVPRDRDQVFVKMDGIFPYLADRRWSVRNLENFGHRFEDLKGLTLSGTYLDRRYLTELTLQDWIEIADSLQNSITDAVITKALDRIPQEVRGFSYDDLRSKLVKRRDNLTKAAKRYYKILARDVDVVGSDKHEYFEVERLANKDVRVAVYKITKEGEVKKKLYERTFHPDETKQVRLYGLGGSDSFRVYGERSKIKIRIFGGDGKDILINNGKGKITYYDYEKYEIEGEGKTKKEIYEEPRSNEYDLDRKPRKYGFVAPAALFGYNADDGIFLGGGVTIKTYGFRKDPFSTSHLIAANYAFLTGSFNLKYEGYYVDILKGWDLDLKLSGNFPNYTGNFYGFGNETTFNDSLDRHFYDVRYDLFTASPSFVRRISRIHSLAIGAYYQYAKLDDNQNKFITTQFDELNPAELFNAHNYGGVLLKYIIDSRDNDFKPFRGWHWNTFASYNYDLNGSDDNFFKVGSDISVYLTAYLPLKTTLALRLGGASNFGDYNFYQANYIGGNTNLRGYRKDRFAGDKSIYQNTDLRIKLFNLNTYLLTGDFGILGFNDFGRVWYIQEESDKLHHGYGGGIWLSPFNLAVISATYGMSNEDALFYVKFGFLF